MVRNLKKRLDRNLRRSGRNMARELNTSQYSIRQMLKNEPLKFQKVQELTRLRLDESGELPNIVVSDEKTFVVHLFVNIENDRVYLPKRSAVCTFGWPQEHSSAGQGNGVDRHNSRWSLSARINRPWHQNKCQILL